MPEPTAQQVEPWAVVVDGDCPPVVIEHLREYAVTVELPADVLVVTIGDQGPPGIPGPPGAANGAEQNPAFTYTGGQVSCIDYASGAYKVFTYAGGVLTQLDYVAGGTTTRKSFTYNPDGTLAAITQVQL